MEVRSGLIKLLSKEGNVMTKFFKLVVAGAMVLGVSTAMADIILIDQCADGLGMQDTGGCCVYDANENLVLGKISNIATSEDGNITMKCYAINVLADKKATIFDNDNNTASCNMPLDYTRTVGENGVKTFTLITGISADEWQNVVSATNNDFIKIKKNKKNEPVPILPGITIKTTNSSLICEYLPN